MFKVRVFTLYPEVFPGSLGIGIYKRAEKKKIWSLQVIDIRKQALDKHRKVDDTPFGGGSGMVIKPDIIANSLDKYILNNKNEKIIYLSTKGKMFNQKMAKNLSKKKTINIICGHFEGIDQRVLETRNIEEVSIGDYILSGGENASLVLIDTILRLIPGVLGNCTSLKEESFENGLLEYPHYTKPQKWEKKSVPKVLLSGNHAKIKDWRLSQSKAITRRLRPDLWKKYKKNKKK